MVPPRSLNEDNCKDRKLDTTIPVTAHVLKTPGLGVRGPYHGRSGGARRREKTMYRYNLEEGVDAVA